MDFLPNFPNLVSFARGKLTAHLEPLRMSPVLSGGKHKQTFGVYRFEESISTSFSRALTKQFFHAAAGGTCPKQNVYMPGVLHLITRKQVQAKTMLRNLIPGDRQSWSFSCCADLVGALSLSNRGCEQRTQSLPAIQKTPQDRSQTHCNNFVRAVLSSRTGLHPTSSTRAPISKPKHKTSIPVQMTIALRGLSSGALVSDAARAVREGVSVATVLVSKPSAVAACGLLLCPLAIGGVLLANVDVLSTLDFASSIVRSPVILAGRVARWPAALAGCLLKIPIYLLKCLLACLMDTLVPDEMRSEPPLADDEIETEGMVTARIDNETNEPITVALKRANDGSDVITYLKKTHNLSIVSLEYETPNKLYKGYPEEEPLFNILPATSNSIRLNAVSVSSALKCSLTQALKQVGLSMTEVCEFEVCIFGLLHPRIGFRKKGTDSYVFFDLRANGPKPFTTAHAFAIEDTRLNWIKTSKSSVNLKNTSMAAVRSNAIDVIESFGDYTFFGNNCQRFVEQLARKVGLHELARRKVLISRPLWTD